MAWLAALLELLEFLEFLTSALGLSALLWAGLYYGLSQGLQLDWAQSVMLSALVACNFYSRVERHS
jgi:hypothetical protein